MQAGPTSAQQELKTLVREAHKRGMEVLLDVVFNHTAEGNEMGPHISFRGIDNRRHVSALSRSNP
jgi:isoamylase